MGWRTLFFCFWLSFWTWGGWLAFKATIAHGNAFLELWLVFWATGEVVVGGSIVWSILGQVVLTLDPASLSLAWRIAGFEVRNRTFVTSEIRNLRYRPIARSGRTQNLSAICFESGSKTYRFGSGIADAVAFALIDRMLDVYPFPKDRALEYMDLSR